MLLSGQHFEMLLVKTTKELRNRGEDENNPLDLFKKLHNPVSPATVARLGEKFLRGQELIPPNLQLTQQDQHQVF